jgi:hypothetical protein
MVSATGSRSDAGAGGCDNGAQSFIHLVAAEVARATSLAALILVCPAISVCWAKGYIHRSVRAPR